jgi:hypothetical protein
MLEVRELHRQDAAWLEQQFHARDEVVQIRTCASTLLPSSRSGLP